MVGGFHFQERYLDKDARFRLSRFAYCRRDEDVFVIESPLSLVRTIIVGSECATLTSLLAQPRTYRNLCNGVGGLTEGGAQAFLNLLSDAGVVGEVDNNGRMQEEENPTLMQWEFHDLLFHFRSRVGRHDYTTGGTYPFLGKIEPLPALKPTAYGERFRLYKPDINHLVENDRYFTSVLENSKSVRRYGSKLITAQQLGEFLYRVTRVRNLFRTDHAQMVYYETTDRPYPSGGAAFDIELYVLVNACESISSGIYHYDPSQHQLGKIDTSNAYLKALLRDAQYSAALPCLPHILIILASRFQRLSWKYRSIAYSTVLKNVGVLYQTMYLVATAMELAPCALETGNSTLFADGVGTDYFLESSVGEFILDSL